MRFTLTIASLSLLAACAGTDSNPVPSKRPGNEMTMTYNCPGSTVELHIGDSGWTKGDDPTVYPEPNTKGEWSYDDLVAAAC